MNLWFKDVKTRVADGTRLRVKSNPRFPFLFLFLVLKNMNPLFYLLLLLFIISVLLCVYVMCVMCECVWTQVPCCVKVRVQSCGVKSFLLFYLFMGFWEPNLALGKHPFIHGGAVVPDLPPLQLVTQVSSRLV